VHGKFATIYAAGCAAIRFKVFPFTHADLLEAVMTCERDHIAFIAKSSAALMRWARTGSRPRRARRTRPLRPISTVELPRPSSTYARPAQAFRQGTCTPALPLPGDLSGQQGSLASVRLLRADCWGPAECQALKTELHAKRLIASEGRGKRQYFSVKRDIPGLGRVRVIALRAR
jgi:hypothetical protein